LGSCIRHFHSLLPGAILLCAVALPAAFLAAEAHAQKLELPRGTSAVIDKIYSFDTDGAVAEALRLGAISFDAVKMLLLARLENRPARLDLTFYPYLPAATVGATDPRAYLGLIANARIIPATAGVSA